jgi:phosphatidylserine decarboxylase
MRFATEAWPLVLPPLAVGILLLVLSRYGGGTVSGTWGIVALILALAILLFFRDPARTPPANPLAVVSPADGKVIIAETLPDGQAHVAIFLSVLDVHVNRAPYCGKIETVTTRPGKYLNAGSPAAGEANARCEVTAATDHGLVRWRQVSGLIARKISCRVRPGDEVRTGERFGLIYFGSRMDVYLSARARLAVRPGDRVRAGESVIAEFTTETMP